MSTLTILIVAVFCIGYLCIALESLTKVNKAAIALLMCVLCWTLLMLDPMSYYPSLLGSDVIHHISEVIEHHLGDAAGTLFFLMGAMTIVEIVDSNGGFNFVRDTLKTRSKRKLMWRMTFMTFFLSAILDNLTTSIVMIMVLRKLVQSREDRLIYAALVVIAANSGGAFSPIGDVTTIMLWIKGVITTQGVLTEIFIPSLVSMLVPAFILQYQLEGKFDKEQNLPKADVSTFTKSQRDIIFWLGVGGLCFVPIFKTITHLPPFMGILLVLGLLWTVTEIFHYSASDDDTMAKRVSD
jgi:Na+/H+ antiporter NhaD/arsenite permease-like protein